MNHLLSLSALHNRYVVLRHGESLANVAGIIVSDPQHGLSQYGLSAQGRQQVIASLQGPHGLEAHTRLYSSDFLRARETAALVQTQLRITEAICYRACLRERYFGDFEGTSSANYQRVWAADVLDPWQTHHAVESAAAVLQRLSRFVCELEAAWHGQTILLVSHGDPLQILQTGFMKQSPARHRHLPPLQTAAWRELHLLASGAAAPEDGGT